MDRGRWHRLIAIQLPAHYFDNVIPARDAPWRVVYVT